MRLVAEEGVVEGLVEHTRSSVDTIPLSERKHVMLPASACSGPPLCVSSWRVSSPRPRWRPPVRDMGDVGHSCLRSICRASGFSALPAGSVRSKLAPCGGPGGGFLVWMRRRPG